MRRFLSIAAAIVLAVTALPWFSLSPELSAQVHTPASTAPAPMKLTIGDAAPDFTLRDQSGKEVSLKDFRDHKKTVVLAFYVFAFSGGCTKEVKAFQQSLAQLEAANTQVLGISMDSTFANKAWAEQLGVQFPLLSDWGGDVTQLYGVYNPKNRASRRVTFVISPEGKIEHIQLDSAAIDPTDTVAACERKKKLNE